MRNLYYHYTAVITPFVFISAIYGGHFLFVRLQRRFTQKLSAFIIISLLLVPTVLFAYFKGPLPFAKQQQMHPIKYPAKEAADVAYWAKILRFEKWKVAATGHIAPYFSARRYFYAFNPWYDKADYIILRKAEVFNYPEKNVLIPVYEKLVRDERYVRIFSAHDLEVYKKVLYATPLNY